MPHLKSTRIFIFFSLNFLLLQNLFFLINGMVRAVDFIENIFLVSLCNKSAKYADTPLSYSRVRGTCFVRLHAGTALLMAWMPPPPRGIVMCHCDVLKIITQRESTHARSHHDLPQQSRNRWLTPARTYLQSAQYRPRQDSYLFVLRSTRAEPCLGFLVRVFRQVEYR